MKNGAGMFFYKLVGTVDIPDSPPCVYAKLKYQEDSRNKLSCSLYNLIIINATLTLC
jgi:hypothetical protein